MRAWIDEIVTKGGKSDLLVTTRSRGEYDRALMRLREAGYKPNNDLETEPFEDSDVDADGDEYLITDDLHMFTVTLPFTSRDPAFDEAYDKIATVIEAA